MAEPIAFPHADCIHFEPCGNSECPDQGNCTFLAEWLRQEKNTPITLVRVDGVEQAAEVWLDNMQVMKGCPHFEPLEEALDSLAEELQSPFERFGVCPNE